MNLLRAFARPLLAAPFLADGISALRDPAPHVERVRAVWPTARRLGAPELSEDEARTATRVLGGVSVAAALGLLVPPLARPSATVLAVLSVPLALTNNPVWLDPAGPERGAHAEGLVRSLALTGGLAIASVDRRGRPSAVWRARDARVHRSELRQARRQARTAVAQARQADREARA